MDMITVIGILCLVFGFVIGVVVALAAVKHQQKDWEVRRLVLQKQIEHAKKLRRIMQQYEDNKQ